VPTTCEIVFEQVIKIIPTLEWKAGRIEALTSLIKRVSADCRGVVKQAIDLAEAMATDEMGVAALMRAICLLPVHDRRAFVAGKLSLIRGFSDSRGRAMLLGLAARALDGNEAQSLLTEAFKEIHSIKDEGAFVWTLHSMIDCFDCPAPVFEMQIVALARQMMNPENRAQVLTALAAKPSLTLDVLPIWQDALQNARQIEDISKKANRLADIARQAPRGFVIPFLAELIELGKKISEWDRLIVIRSIVDVAMPSDEKVIVGALSLAQHSQSDHDRADSLAVVAQKLPADLARVQLSEALRLQRAIHDDEAQLRTSAIVAMTLSSDDSRERLRQIAERVQALPYVASKARAMSALIPYCLSTGRTDVLKRTIDGLRRLPRYERDSFDVFLDGIPANQTSLLINALDVARALDDDQRCISIIQKLGTNPNTRPDQRRQLMRIASEFKEPRTKTRALLALVHGATLKDQRVLIASAVKSARLEQTPWLRVWSLTDIAG
jgi:hypothetical protein